MTEYYQLFFSINHKPNLFSEYFFEIIMPSTVIVDDKDERGVCCD